MNRQWNIINYMGWNKCVALTYMKNTDQSFEWIFSGVVKALNDTKSALSKWNGMTVKFNL